MRYYEDTSAPLTEEGIKSVEKVKKIVEDYFHTFKGNEPLSLQYMRPCDEYGWEPSEWADHGGFNGKIFNIDNVEWIEYFFGAYLTDEMTQDERVVDVQDNQYLDITFYKNVSNDYTNGLSAAGTKTLQSLANQVKADLTYSIEEIESQRTSTDWKGLPLELPKSWIDKFKKFNGKEIDDGQIMYSGSGDDGSVEFFDGSLWGDNTPTPMHAMGFTQAQIGKMYDLYEESFNPHSEHGVICGYEEDWTSLIDDFTNSFANFNNEGCHGEIKSIFFYDENKHTYLIEHSTECSYGGQSTVNKIMLVEDFLKTKPRMN